MGNDRIPVIQLIDGFATEEHAGGAAQFGIQLARHLDRQQYGSVVCGLWGYGTASERRWRAQLDAEGIATHILVDQPRHLGLDLVRAFALLRQLVTDLHPAIINSHFERGDLLALLTKLTHPAQIILVRTMHTEQQWQKRPWLGQLLNMVALPWIFDGEVAISRATQSAMNRRVAACVGGRRAELLYNGLSQTTLARLSALRAQQHREAAQPARIAIIGRLEQQKGHSYLLHAAVEVLDTFPQTTFWVIGTGPLLSQLQAAAHTLGIAHAVQFLGQRNDVPELLAQVDLLVSPSLWEGFPTVLLEGMAAGVPVIATDVSGSRELVRSGETGVLVPMQDAHALARAIDQMLRRPAWARQMATAAHHAVQRYTLDETAAGYEHLYGRLLKTER